MVVPDQDARIARRRRRREFAELLGALLFAAAALGLVAAIVGVDHWRDRPQFNTINHNCLDVACIVRSRP